jgi:hemerythrin
VVAAGRGIGVWEKSKKKFADCGRSVASTETSISSRRRSRSPKEIDGIARGRGAFGGEFPPDQAEETPRMSLIRWQDSLMTGVASIDADHQVLVSLLNQLSDVREEGQARDVVGSVLNVLIEYVVDHFHHEEGLMAQCSYPELAEHQSQHQRIAVRVEKLRQQYQSGRHTAVDELLEFLKNWFVEHIIGEDTRITPWVEGAGLSPEELA